MTATLSLYRLDEELTDLLAYRQERVDDQQSPASAEELEACDTAIRQYMEQLPRKVDGVAAVLRYFDEQVEFADREIARLRERKRQVEANIERVEGFAAAVLEKQPQPAKGCRKLVGSHSTLMLKGNGGVQPLVISQPDLIPDELCVWRGELHDTEFCRIMRSLSAEWPPEALNVVMSRFTRIPSNSLIREALIQPCAACDGTGAVDVQYEYAQDRVGCAACGGTGKNAVPGAHPEPRGRHIEIK